MWERRLLVLGAVAASSFRLGRAAVEPALSAPEVLTSVVLPTMLRSLSHRWNDEVLWEPEVKRCVQQNVVWADEFLANLTRASSLIHEPPGDLLLVMRGALRRLSSSLLRTSEAITLCVASDADNASVAMLREAAERLTTLVEQGRINDGHCPFTGKAQTTLGGVDVRRELKAFMKCRWEEGNETGLRKGSKALGKLLRKARTADNQDPSGMPPVNWVMRSAMFGGDRLEL